MPVIHLRVVGKVQGVGFRWFVRERAEELGISGWVRNTSEGAVEVAANGDAANLQLFEAAVRRGPAGAWVQRVEQLPASSDTSLPSPFRIER